MTENLALVRSTIRKDLTSMGMIPTGVGIQLVAQEDKALGLALFCEAVYVQMYNGKDLDKITAYMEGPLQLSNLTARNYIISSVLRVRSALSKFNGDHNAAYKELMQDKGAEKEVIQKIIEACVRTSKEFNVPWSKTYLPDFSSGKSSGGYIGCALVIAILSLILYGVYKLIRWIF